MFKGKKVKTTFSNGEVQITSLTSAHEKVQ